MIRYRLERRRRELGGVVQVWLAIDEGRETRGEGRSKEQARARMRPG